MNANRFFIPAALVSLLVATGCGSSRDVEVTGEVKSAAALQGEILLEFFEVTGEGEDTERTSVHSATLDATGEFTETVSVDGDVLVIYALDDADGNGACTEGEAWAEVEADISEDDTVEGVELSLGVKACPAVEQAE